MDILEKYLALIDGIKLSSLFGLIALDWVLGVVLAIFDKTFDWKKLANFLDTDVLKLAVGYFAIGLFALADPSLRVAVWTTWAAIDAKLLADLYAKFKKLGVVIKKESV